MTDTPEELTINGATCRLYRTAPQWDGLRTAAIGGFRCAEAQGGAALLASAEEKLRSEGFEALIGPMDGDTWHSYRLVTESDGSPPFLLEPTSGPHDGEAFAAQGFTPVSAYVSTRAPLERAIGDSVSANLDGVVVEPWNGENAKQLLGGLFDMSSASFAANPFYQPISREAFLAIYEPLLPAVDPRLIFFARDSDGLAGFLFGLPNMVEGARPRSAIVKTYASRRRGVGHLLLDNFHRAARDLGFQEVIHALMHEDNISLNSSLRYGTKVFRRYALMGKRLQAP